MPSRDRPRVRWTLTSYLVIAYAVVEAILIAGALALGLTH